MHFVRTLAASAKLAGIALALAAVSQHAAAQGKGLDEPFRDGYKKALAGKTVGYIPVAMGFDLAQGWYNGLKKELEPAGMKVVARDPNWNTNAGAQAFTALMAEKPAVIVIHNPDVQTYAKLIKKAEEDGIYVVQINMRSVQPSTVFVGADWVDVGERNAEAVVQACKGKSNKIAIVQGAPTAATSAYTLKGVENVLAKNPQIKVVSNQAADWDAAKAKGLTQTVLKQNPRPVRHRRLLGRHGHRHRGRHQGSRPDRQGLPRDLGRRRAERRLRPGQVGRLRPRRELRRADAGRQHGRHDQVAGAGRHEARRGQAEHLHHADPDHEGERGCRRHLLEAHRRQVTPTPEPHR
jgi:ABC-type sugar transport system substrate-binding protein